MDFGAGQRQHCTVFFQGGRNIGRMVNKGARLLQNAIIATTPSRPGGPISFRTSRGALSPNEQSSDDEESRNAEVTRDQSRHEGQAGILVMGGVRVADETVAVQQKAAEKSEKRALRSRMSGLSKFMNETPGHHEDFDAGVNAMALLCALVLSIPYDIVQQVSHVHLDWLQVQLDKCQDGEADFSYEDIYMYYRLSFLATVYWSISGMIMATFYFIFKRTDKEDYALWYKKARWLVISLFMSTSFAICSLILLTNIYFDYYILSTDANICDNGTMQYVIPGMCTAVASFLWGFYLIM